MEHGAAGQSQADLVPLFEDVEILGRRLCVRVAEPLRRGFVRSRLPAEYPPRDRVRVIAAVGPAPAGCVRHRSTGLGGGRSLLVREPTNRRRRRHTPAGGAEARQSRGVVARPGGCAESRARGPAARRARRSRTVVQYGRRFDLDGDPAWRGGTRRLISVGLRPRPARSAMASRHG